MSVADVLKQKATAAVETVGASDPIRSAIERFLAVKVRCLVVMEGTQVVGMVTMRDLLRVIHEEGGSLDTPVRKAMSSDLASVTPATSNDEVQQLIAQRGINHVPVLDNGRLVGLVTLADVLSTHLQGAEGLNEELRRYIHGPYAL